MAAGRRAEGADVFLPFFDYFSHRIARLLRWTAIGSFALFTACGGGAGGGEGGRYPPPTSIAVLRFGQGGAPDATFGMGKGIVLADFNPIQDDQACSVVLQSDGKIIVAANSVSGTQSLITLLRYNVDGTLDVTFGNGGSVRTAIGSIDADFPKVALQSDGKIVVAGSTSTPFVVSEGIFLARYNADGTPDSSFGGGQGIITPTIGSGNSNASALVLQPDGKIVVVGNARLTSNVAIILRFNQDGTLDSSFGANGIASTASAPPANAVVLQLDGKILVATDKSLLRYDATGTVDSSFGGGGIVATSGRELDGIALQPDGKIMAVGSVAAASGWDFAVFRFNGDGTLDNSFGAGQGFASRDVGTFDNARALALQPDGKIIAAGFTVSANGLSSEIVLLRYDAGGALDATFGTGGVVMISASGPSVVAAANAIVLEPNGTIVVAGYD